MTEALDPTVFLCVGQSIAMLWSPPADGTVTTQALIAEVGAGRYREVLSGAYL